MEMVEALCKIGPTYFQYQAQNIEIILRLNSLSIAEISRMLLKLGTVSAAERIIGAFKQLKEESKAKQIQKDLEAAGYQLNSVNPFKSTYHSQLNGQKILSPHAGRIKLKWQTMRETVLKIMPPPPGMSADTVQTIKVIWETYKQDAYHSLSIEGYHVTEELIEKIEQGLWDPNKNRVDHQQKDAMAVKGYLNTFKMVLGSLKKILAGANPAKVLEDDLQTWYRELYAPAFQANIISADVLAGYRNSQMYISGSRHIPSPRGALLDCMEVFWELLKNEPNAAVRAILGHFIFVFIHPYGDGNGRIGRFILNLMLISGGYKWTIIHVERRAEYMQALETASVLGDIAPFAEFIKSELG